MRKISLILFGLIAIVLLLLSFRKSEITVLVEGKVLAKGKGLPGVTVSLELEDLDKDVIYDTPTFKDGTYQLQFTVEENAKVQLNFSKEGYEGKSMSFLPSSEDLNPNFMTVSYTHLTLPTTPYV